LSKPSKEVVQITTADLRQWLHVFWHLIAESAYSRYVKKHTTHISFSFWWIRC